VAVRSDLPFKLDHNRMVIVKQLPAMQCKQCGEYSLEDEVMARVEQMLQGADESAELEIIQYAA